MKSGLCFRPLLALAILIGSSSSFAARDTIPPTVPGNFHLKDILDTSVTLVWDASTDNKHVKRYEVFRDGRLISKTRKLSYIDRNISPDREYTYMVLASDNVNTSDAASLELIRDVKTGVAEPAPAESAGSETQSPNTSPTTGEADTPAEPTEPDSTDNESATDAAEPGIETEPATVEPPAVEPAPTQPTLVLPEPVEAPDTIEAEVPAIDNTPGTSDSENNLTEAGNIALLTNNATRNTQFDDNPFRDVPSADISVSDLTLNYDAYNEALLDTTNSGYFRVKCETSHFAFDDPIVFPNQPGRAHLHMFFGNTQTNAFSTYESLLNSGTSTCNGEDLNRTAYWVPALLDNKGNALIPDQIMVYYKNDNFRLEGANELVSPFPENLRMIAGNGAAQSPQTEFSGDWQAQPIVSFACGPAYRSNDRRQALIPDCFGSDQLEMQIAFPQCVNESAGTYQPDQSHISYSENGYYGVRCPDSHPTDISSIMYRIFFRPDNYGGALTDLHLSSDVKMDKILPGGTTAHADWFGAWHREALDLWTENCNNSQADCETGLLQRDPPISLVPRKRNFYPAGYSAPAEELVKLCPGKTHNAEDPLRSVAMCRM